MLPNSAGSMFSNSAGGGLFAGGASNGLFPKKYVPIKDEGVKTKTTQPTNELFFSNFRPLNSRLLSRKPHN